MLTFQALLLNSIWAMLSLLIVMAALAVGRETRQIRSRARIRAELPVVIYLPDGRLVTGTTRDLSQGGGRVAAERPEDVAEGAEVDIEFAFGADPLLVPARILRWEQRLMQMAFQPRSLAEEANVVEAVFGRADAWADWAAYPEDRPLASLWRVLVSIRGLFRPPARAARRAARHPQARSRRGATRRRRAAPRRRPRRAAAGLPAAGAAARRGCGAAAGGAGQRDRAAGAGAGHAARPAGAGKRPAGFRGRAAAAPAPIHAERGAGRLQPGLLCRPVRPGAGRHGHAPGLPGVPAAEPAAPSPVAAEGQTRRVVLSLRQLGALGPLTLRGTSELQGVQFGVRADEVVTAAELTVSGATSPALLPEYSNVTVTLNEQYVGTIPVSKDQPKFDGLAMPVSPVFFQDNNRLNFHFTGRYTAECNDPLSGLLWATISDRSTLTLTLERLPPQRDLARLPLPFFDNHEKQAISLPFVLAGNPSNETLQAAGIVSSWFGQLADYRGASFPVTNAPPADGNAIVVGTAQDLAGLPGMPAIGGPTLAVIAEPRRRRGLAAGRLGPDRRRRRGRGQHARARGPRARRRRWPPSPNRTCPGASPMTRPTGSPPTARCASASWSMSSDLQGCGYVPGTMRVPFRTAPDLFTWRNRGFPLVVHYRAPPGPIIDLAVSRLDVGVNNLFLASFPLADAPATSWFGRLFRPGSANPTARLDVPAYYVFGQNDLQFFFDTRPLHRGDCVAVPQDVRESIDPDSTIDLSAAYRFAQLPNLAYFVNSGFPFTRLADLSETAVVLPDQPAPVEISAFLDMMGRIGSITGYPVIRVAVVRPEQASSVPDRDLLVIGTLPRLAGAAELLKNSPIQLNGSRLDVDLGGQLDAVTWLYGDQAAQQRREAAAQLGAPLSAEAAALVGTESPLRSGRSVVAVLAAAPPALEAAIGTMRDSRQAPQIQGDLAILSGGRATSYRVGGTYTVGHLAPWVWPSWALRNSPVSMLAVTIAGCVLLGLVFYGMLRRRSAARTARTTRV